MDSNWRPVQGQPTTDWRLQLLPEARRRILINLMGILKQHVPSPELLGDLQQVATRFEEKIYNESTSQGEYLRKISLKILWMDKNRHGFQVNPASNSNPNFQNQNCMDPGPNSNHYNLFIIPSYKSRWHSISGRYNQSMPVGTQSMMAGMINNTMVQPVGPSRLVRPNLIYDNSVTAAMNGGMTTGMTGSIIGMSNDVNGGMSTGMNGSMSNMHGGVTTGMTGSMIACMNGRMTTDMNRGMPSGMSSGNTTGMAGEMITDMNGGMASGMNSGMPAEMSGGMRVGMNGGMAPGMMGGMIGGMAGEMQMQHNQLNMVHHRQQNYAVGINVTDLQEQHRQMKMRQNQMREHHISQNQMHENQIHQQNQMRENQILQNQMRENQNLQNQMHRNQHIMNPLNMANSHLIQGVASSSTAQTAVPIEVEAEELYQKVKFLKEQHLADLIEIYERLSLKLNKPDMDLTNPKVADRHEKMTSFKTFMRQLLDILQLDKLQCVQRHFSLKEKLPRYEQQIIHILKNHKIAPSPHHEQQMPPHQQQLITPPKTQSPSPAQPQQQMPPPQQRSQTNTKPTQLLLAQQQPRTPTQLVPATSPLVPSPSPPVTPSSFKPVPILHNSSRLVQTGKMGRQGRAGLKIGTPTSSSFVPSPPPSVEKPMPPAQQPQPSQTGRLKHDQCGSAVTSVPSHQTDRLKHEQSGSAGTPVPTPDNKISTEITEKSSGNEISPIERLAKALRAGSNNSGLHSLIKSAVTDVYSAIHTVDCDLSGSTSDRETQAAIESGLVPMGKRHLPDRNWDDQPPLMKLKWDVSARRLNDDNESCVEIQNNEVNNQRLMEEIKKINSHLIDTELIVSEDESNADSSKGTIVKCVHTGVAIVPILNSHLSPILPLRLLLPAGNPKPVILDKLPEEERDSDDLSTKARSHFRRWLRGLSEPLSLKEITHKWDSCAREVILDYAQQNGGSTFSSSFCTWQKII